MNSDILKFLYTWIGTIIIGIFLTEVDVGVYSIALKLSTIAGIFVVAANSIAMPKYGEFYGSNDLFSMQRSLRYTAKIIFYTAVPVIFLILIFSGPILSFLGAEFSYGFFPLLFLLAGQLFEAMGGSSNYFLQMVGKQNIYLKIILVSTVCLALSSLLLIPFFGIIGAAASLLMVSILQTLLLVFYIKKQLGLRSYFIPFLTKLNSKI